MKLSYLVLKKTTLALTLIMLTISGSALANTGLSVTSVPGKYVTFNNADVTLKSDGLHIEGSLKSSHFSPRRPLSGLVTVMVQDSQGQLILEKELQASSLFVPKGIRQVQLSGVLVGEFPADSRVTITPKN